MQTFKKYLFLQVKLDDVTLVTGVATQGRYDRSQWVTSYQLQYSDNGKQFMIYTENGKVKVCLSVFFLYYF